MDSIIDKIRKILKTEQCWTCDKYHTTINICSFCNTEHCNKCIKYGDYYTITKYLCEPCYDELNQPILLGKEVDTNGHYCFWCKNKQYLYKVSYNMDSFKYTDPIYILCEECLNNNINFHGKIIK